MEARLKDAMREKNIRKLDIMIGRKKKDKSGDNSNNMSLLGLVTPLATADKRKLNTMSKSLNML